MSSTRTFVVVGGGLAGAKTAEALRDKDFDGSIVLLSEEEHLPYERPPLSKEHFAGKKALGDFTVHHGDWYRDHHVDLRLGTTATALDLTAHTVTLPDGSTLGYDKLALATGSRSRRPPISGSDAEGVHYLRTIDESDKLIDAVAGGRRLVVIGAGWIGLEVGASAREKGADVTVVEAAEVPLLGSLGPEIGSVFAELHREHGVQLHLGATVEEIVVEDGKATGVRLGDGTVLPADAVLVAVGAAPNIEIAERAGLDVDGGILVDAGLQTSDPDVVAVGDIAAQWHPQLGTRIRVEHWANALNQPAVAAATMLGHAAEYGNLPYFFTDQFDLGMEYVGYAPHDSYDRVVVRGDFAAREFVAFWLDADNHVLAGMNVNIWDVTDQIKQLVSSSAPIDPDRLADPAVPLTDLSG
ncbi:NAD/ferredoxin-dependent reductase-like protein [Rhodococcus wratislaviensis]|uniref:Ferredoxin--NAD(+) reductase n=2 Tax=Rhodococcus wratislaviensis TaxID=44752 RepID=A0AB38FFG9_RHOWR|nr:FAD-dependent oxidoreductase [Rhodococcus wratislaviensis]REE76838.1 NAD/ferredoxin-dependent reductase-like protein [Rhodococcus wratislaviensis]GAF47352.1 putative ferredoxin reductase [Rhodococcus wratislaviensis NBRC 100605]SPZ40365.1 ferredoxin--NAD(+) reductase [Rhodococcus wratislaviensis]